jgi:CheY-like chemotaxis protein
VPQESCVLVLGEPSTSLSALAENVRRLGFRTVRAKTPPDAVSLAIERRLHYGVALLPADLPVVDLSQALDTLRRAAQSPELTAIATGQMPSEEERGRLRHAGVGLALWEPIGEHALRFYLNRALFPARERVQRGRERMPTDWSARVYTAGRAKPASVYSLSPTGVYLETRRPSQKGAQVAVALQLPDGEVSVAGCVVYTNVPGNLQRRRLPNGMAVHFTEMTELASRALERGVSSCAARFQL